MALERCIKKYKRGSMLADEESAIDAAEREIKHLESEVERLRAEQAAWRKAADILWRALKLESVGEAAREEEGDGNDSAEVLSNEPYKHGDKEHGVPNSRRTDNRTGGRG
jgi:hypothetical protein